MPLSSTAAQMPPWLRCNRVRGSRLLALFASVLVPLYLFGALAEDVIEKEAFGFDLYPLLFMHSHATPLLDSVMVAFSLWGSGLAMAPVDALVLLLLARRRRWGEVLFFGVAVGGAAVLNFAAKYAFGRVRPALWLSIAPETTFSFPSGHAMATMALVSALLVLAWPTRWRWLTLTLGTPFVLLVGLSRVYLGVHYPSDIFAGWAASLAWVAGLSAISYRNLTPPAPQATWTSMKCRCCRPRPIEDAE